ncbi:MAG: stage III sporulation protein AF [Clostridia bacterium]|nr:stage III sporulation protein AF [Clostridia bacterium]
MKTMVGEWISNLAVIAILAALVDMVLPNGNLRKYTSFLFGLVILVMFLQPIFYWIGQEPKLEYEVFKNSFNQQTQNTSWQKELIEEKFESRLEEMMKETLEKELTLELKYKTGMDDLLVGIKFGQNNRKTDYSQIQRIDITAPFKDSLTQIDGISIGIGKNHAKAENDTGSSSTDMIKELRQHISKLYNIEPGIIYINGK